MIRVLVVDDSGDVRDVLDKALGMMNYSVTAVPSREHALAELKSRKPDVIIMDFAMSGMSLDEFMTILNKQKKRPPVILFTAAYDAPQKAREFGLIHYIGKPFDLANLECVIQESLSTSA